MVCAAVMSLIVTVQGPTPLNDKKNVELFMNSFEKFLGVTPTDGRFGISRLPTIHKSNSINEAADTHFNYLLENNYVAAFTFGKSETEELRYSTIPSYFKLDFPDRWYSSIRDGFNKESELFQVTARAVAREHLKSNRKDLVHKFKYADHDAFMYTKKVFARDEKCLSCHTNVKKGEPIGIIGLIQVPKDK